MRGGVVNEGYNLDIRATMKKYRAQFKAECVDCKKAIKRHDKETALSHTKNMRAIIEQCKDEIEKTSKNYDVADNVGSAVIGYFTGVFADMTYFLKAVLLVYIPVLGPIAVTVMGIKKLIQEISILVEDIRDNEDTVDWVKTFNMYRNISLAKLKDLEGVIKNLESRIQKMD